MAGVLQIRYDSVEGSKVESGPRRVFEKAQLVSKYATLQKLILDKL